jgi:hypothetical protein
LPSLQFALSRARSEDAEVLVALRKQVQAGQRVTVLARVEDQARRLLVRPAKEPSAASLDPLTLLVRCGRETSVARVAAVPREPAVQLCGFGTSGFEFS